MKSQVIEMIWYKNHSSRTFRYNHFVTTYLINKTKRERRAMCAYFRTNYYENNLQNINNQIQFHANDSNRQSKQQITM
jgi:hypothetical protein